MSEGEEDSWVFDSLVNFLHGPIWKLPVLSFIEDKSVVFDPDSLCDLTDEKEGEFLKIHEEYKALVDYMLGSFMEDLQVTAEQVEEACHGRERSSRPESNVTKVSLEQLWAAEDFRTFQRLMVRKNIDLQLQSLELLVARYGILSPSLRPEDGDGGEEDFLQVVLRYAEAHVLLPDFPSLSHILTRRSSSRSIVRDYYDFLPSQLGEDDGKGLMKMNMSSEAMKASGELFADPPPEEIAELVAGAPEQRRILASVRQALEETPQSSKSLVGLKQQQQHQANVQFKQPDEQLGVASDEDIEKRREYLRAQRDKLVALKKKEREAELKVEENVSRRPKSAKAAQMALHDPKNTGGLNEKSLLARRALAQRLKKELVDN